MQETYLDTICPDWRNGNYDIHGLREQLLKARQFGFSTLIAALFFLNTYNTPNTNTVVIADDLDNSQALFKMVNRFYENLSDEKRLPTRYANRRELDWPALNSTYQVLTAGKRQAGRSRTVHNLHMSERPFWDSSDILTGLLQTVPADGNIFDESTANGEGNEYHADYQAGKKGQSTFTPRFFAWFEHREYRKQPQGEFVPTEEEATLATRYGLDIEQLNWRREKMREPGMGNLFVQEYPSNDIEAFRVSGKKFFTEWDAVRNIVSKFDIPRHWKKFGSVDWGYGAPFCFLLSAIDEEGGVVVFHEIYAPRLLNREQSARIVQALKDYGLTSSDVVLYCDPSMWNVKMQQNGVGYRDIDDYFAAGLNCVQASNKRTPTSGSGGWSNVRQYMADAVTSPQTGVDYPALRVFGERCPNLERTIPQMVHDEHNPEDMDSTKEDHASDSLRYQLNAWVRPSAPAVPAPDPEANWPRFLKKKGRAYA